MISFIAEKIRNLRDKYKMSEEQLAEALSVPAVTVIQWERGVNRPTFQQLDKIARFFGASRMELFPQLQG